MDWKQDILVQVKGHKHQWNVYNEIIEHYNALLESNAFLQMQCAKLEQDVNHLRLANAGLERASVVSQELANVHNQLTVANEEVMKHLREKGELAREVLRLNHALTDLNDKLIKTEAQVLIHKTEKEQLAANLEKSEAEVNELVEINQVLRDEFQAVHVQFDQLQADYNRKMPSLCELESNLEKERRKCTQLETDLLESKKVQLEMLNAEVERFNTKQKQRVGSETLDNDMVCISAEKSSRDPHVKDHKDATALSRGSSESSLDDPTFRDRRNTVPGSATAGRGGIFKNFMGIFRSGASDNMTDKLNRTSTLYVSSSLPTQEVHQFECTDLEVYALQFQPSGSILATGCSDKMIHLWEILSSGHSYKYTSLHGSHGAINALDFDNEGARLLAGCSGEKAYVWSYGDNRGMKDTFTGHTGLIFTCKFISGTKLATGSADRVIKTWDLQSRQCIRNIFAGSKCHDLVVIDASGTIVSGHYNKKICIWDASGDKPRAELSFNAPVTSLSYNIEKYQLLSCFKDDSLKLIDLRQNNVVNTYSHDDFHVSTDTTKGILSPDARFVCSGSHDGSIFIWNASNGTCEKVFRKKHSTMVTSVAWHPEGRFVASCEKHRKVIIWSD